MKTIGCQILTIARFSTIQLRWRRKVCWSDGCWKAEFVYGHSGHRRVKGHLLGS